jgi:hypothetical protein
MSAGGNCNGIVRRAPSTRRFMRWRVLERRAAFFDTTTAYPIAFSGTTATKFGDESRRPAASAVGNVARGIRSRRGNTVLGGKIFTTDAAAALHDLAARGGRTTRKEPVGLRALAFLRLIRSFGHTEGRIRLYTRY